MEARPACVGAFYQNMRRGPPFKAEQHRRRAEQGKTRPHSPGDASEPQDSRERASDWPQILLHPIRNASVCVCVCVLKLHGGQHLGTSARTAPAACHLVVAAHPRNS